MKRAVFFIALVFIGTAFAQKPRVQDTSTNIYLDDIAYPTAGAAFAEAFALETDCHGLFLTRHTGTDDKQKMEALKYPHWFLIFSCEEHKCHGQLSHNPEHGKINRHVTFSSPSVEGSVKKVCNMVKGVGGAVQ